MKHKTNSMKCVAYIYSQGTTASAAAILFTIFSVATVQLALGQSLVLDNVFKPGVTDAASQVYVSKVQTGGKVLIGGAFHYVNGEAHSWLVRLNANGTRDVSFNKGGSGPNGFIYDIVFLSDGQILIGGKFSSYNGIAKAGIARLNADGSLDPSFNLGGSGTSGTVQTIAVQPDGKILFSGSEITSYNGVGMISVVRLNADGSIDEAFASPFSQGTFVEEVDLLPDGKILTGGGFSLAVGLYNIARLNSDGTIDGTFNSLGSGPNGPIYGVEPMSDGKILIAGAFASFNFVPRIGVARLNSDGTLDESFVTSNEPGEGSTAEYFSIQPSGKILVAGSFNYIGGVFSSLRRLNLDGTTDPTFVVNTDSDGYHVIQQDDGEILLTGFFSRIGTGETRLGVVRLDRDGNVDPTFEVSLSIDASITSMIRQPDGRLLVGGNFSRADRQLAHGVVRFNEDGTVDQGFSVGLGPMGLLSQFPSLVEALAVQADGKILVSGRFFQFGNSAKSELVRLNTDGTVDDTFTLPVAALRIRGIKDIAVLTDGKILITGDDLATTTTGPARLVLRLNGDGSLDTTFIVSNLGIVPAGFGSRILLQPDGRIIVCARYIRTGPPNGTVGNIVRFNNDGSRDLSFTPPTVGGSGPPILSDAALNSDGKVVIVGVPPLRTGFPHTARLNSNGTVDTGFNVGSGANDQVYSVAVQSDGKTIIGGRFTEFNGHLRSRLARLNSDGSVDKTFVSGIDALSNNIYSGVTSLLVDPVGRIYLGGKFSTYNGVQRSSLLRLTYNNATFDYDGDSRSDISVFRPATGDWYLQQSTAGFMGVNFGSGEDRIVPADFDGDGKTDVAVYRPSTGIWYVLNSSDGSVVYHNFGIAEDLPAPADYDGDAKADVCVFRPSSGTWYRLNSSTGEFVAVQFGADGDRPTVGDFDGDGKSDIAVYRPSEGAWYQINSFDGTFFGEQFGVATDKVTPADYDGDGKTDIAIYRPSDGLWYVKNSATTTYTPYVFGLAEDIPVPGDFDGDGKADIGVFRPSDGTWYIVNSSTGGYTIQQFGQGGDKPTQSAFGN